MTPTLFDWTHFFGLIAAEIAIVILLAALVSRFVSKPKLVRLGWQTALWTSALVFCSEFFNLRSRSFAQLFPHPEPSSLTASPSLAPSLQNPAHLVNLVKNSFISPLHPVTWPGWLWLSGAAAFLLLNIIVRIWLAGERRRMNPAPTEVLSIAQPLFSPLNLSAVTFRMWQRTRGPVAFGCFRPTVALPLDFTERFTLAQQRAMLVHELAHLAARDPLWFAFADFACAVLWWHPLVWWLRRQFRRACESAADEASAFLPGGPAILAESLVAFGRELSLTRPIGGLGVAGNGLRSDLAYRVQTLLNNQSPWQRLPQGWRWASGAAALLAVLVSTALPIHAARQAPILAALFDPSPTSPANNVKRISYTIEFTMVPNKYSSEIEPLFTGNLQDPPMDTKPGAAVFTDTNLLNFTNTNLRYVSVDFANTRDQSAVLDSSAYARLRQNLQRDGNEWLTAPPGEALPGRQLHVSTQGVESIVLDVDATTGTRGQPAPSVNYIVGTTSLGPSVDIITDPDPKGFHVLTVGRLLEFLGYDDPGPNKPALYSWPPRSAPSLKPLTYTLPLPHFRLRGCASATAAQLGQTIVIRGPLDSTSTQTGTNRLYIFVTLNPAAPTK